MKGKIPEEQLLLDPKIERTAYKNKNKIIKAKVIAKKQDLEEYSF